MTKRSLKETLHSVAHRLGRTPLAVPCYFLLEAWHELHVMYYSLTRPRVAEADVRNVEQNLTFIFKSFNRQRKAKRAYCSIRSYYPRARVVIADDSEVPLRMDGAEVVHLPFNSGVSRGIIAALGCVRTPYVMRLEDDAVLTPRSRVHEQLAFLQAHPEVDLCGIQAVTHPERGAARYASFRMSKVSLLSVGTVIDGRQVVEKTSNWFVARTEAVRKVGYDPSIRMIDHHEFFHRAAGQIVCVQDPHAYAYHCKNPFDWRYRPYRDDWLGDAEYIRTKQLAEAAQRTGNRQGG